MSACCVSGCKNRASSSSSLKFYRIPSGSRPFQANRRRLWLQAIQQANGSSDGLKGNARICGAHFISGEASLDHGSTDFVPSIFTEQTPKKKTKWFFGRRKRRRRKANADLQPSISVEIDSELSKDVQTPSIASRPKETKVLNKTETETKINQPQYISILSETPPSLKFPPGTPEVDKMSPIVLLKPIVAQAGGYRCELCSQTFASVSQLLKHRQQHEKPAVHISKVCGQSFTSQKDFSEHQQVHTKEPSFPCNICDRSFSTVHHLKRHKLLHVKDGRKCVQCGVLFCRQHNHVLFLPQIKVEKPDDDLSNTKPQNVVTHLTPCKLEPSQMTETVETAQSPPSATPLTPSTDNVATPPPPNTCVPPPPTLHTRILSKMFTPKLVKPSLMHPPVAEWKYSRKPGISLNFSSPVPDYPPTFIQPHLPQHPHLPESLQLFSPQRLTSALLEVKRNYDYILKKQKPVKLEVAVKEEPVESLMTTSTHNRKIKEENQRIAYDLETVL